MKLRTEAPEIPKEEKRRAIEFIEKLVELCARYDIWPVPDRDANPYGDTTEIELAERSGGRYGYLMPHPEFDSASMTTRAGFMCGYRKNK